MYKQKVKHLLYEQQNKITDLKKQFEQNVTLQHSENISKQDVLKKNKRDLRHQLKEKQNRNELHVKTIQQVEYLMRLWWAA